jgi:triacylglycerol lipase
VQHSVHEKAIKVEGRGVELDSVVGCTQGRRAHFRRLDAPASKPGALDTARAAGAPRRRAFFRPMMARLQQALTLGALGLALLWVWFWLQAGHPMWAVGGAATLVLGYAAVLGLEFVFLAWAHGSDPTPRPTTAQLLRAWWGEVQSAPAVFCWRQPFCSQRWPDRLVPRVGKAPATADGMTPAAGRGVVLIHGFFCNRGLWNLWLQRLHAQGTPVVAVNLEPIFGSIDEYVRTIDKAVLALRDSTGLAPVAVAHSMGGLALRRWFAEQDDEDRIHHAITIGTPHHGTWLARFAMTRNSRQMRLDSPWLKTLEAREGRQRRRRFTCFYGHCDNIVFPASTATLEGATNRHLPGLAHVHMADAPQPWDELQRQLHPRQPATHAPA